MANPWIKHNGGRPDLKRNCVVQLCFSPESGHITTDGADTINQYFPGFYWSWKWARLGWFRVKKIRVCDEEEYVPIIQYRFDEGELMAIEALRELAQDPSLEITGPEIAPVIKEPTDA